MPIKYEPSDCNCRVDGFCDNPDHPVNKVRKGAYDPLTAKCVEHNCPKLILDALYSTAMKSGHMISIRDFKLSNPICPIHGKRGIISEPFDEIGLQMWFCIDCVAHAIYDRDIPERIEIAKEAINAVRNKQEKEAYPLIAYGAVGVFKYVMSGDPDDIKSHELKEAIKNKEKVS